MSPSPAFPLLNLPDELILQIISYLQSFEKERLAQNRRLYSICSPYFSILTAATRRNARLMRERFGTPRYEAAYEYLPPRLMRILALDEEYCYRAPDSQPERDFLEIKGNFTWLESTSTARHEARYRNLSESLWSDLFAVTENLGVELPRAYNRFMQNGALFGGVAEMSCTGQVYLNRNFGPSSNNLMVCPSDIDGGAGGYVIPIHIDGPRRLTSYLYLDPSNEKGHCVLTCGPLGIDDYDRKSSRGYKEWSLKRRSDVRAAEKSGLTVASMNPQHTWLRATSYEDFLATLYFEGWLSNGDNLRHTRPTRRLSDLREYVTNVYIMDPLEKPLPSAAARRIRPEDGTNSPLDDRWKMRFEDPERKPSRSWIQRTLQKYLH